MVVKNSLPEDRAQPKVWQAPAFSFAYQPIIDLGNHAVIAYEALLRGCDNQPAGAVFAQVPKTMLHSFDELLRQRAIALAVQLGIEAQLSLNFLPRSVRDSDAPIRSTVAAAERHGLPIERLILEVTEGEVIDDHASFANTVNYYRGMGIKIAIDDFGAGYSGLNLLAEFQPDIVKLDMNLVRGIETRGPRQAIVRAILQACGDLGIDFIAEGVETADELGWFLDQGVTLFQGYFLARPAFEALQEFHALRLSLQQDASGKVITA